MNRKLVWISALVIGLASCQKDYSEENGTGSGNTDIIGADCRITKIANLDSASNTGKSALTALIDASDRLTEVTDFDSLSFTIDFFAQPQNQNDTIWINTDEYFITEPATRRVTRLHGLVDPTNPFSPEFDTDYSYDAAGYLLTKTMNFEILPGVVLPIVNTTYTWAGGNMVSMVSNDLIVSNKISDATVTYITTLAPKNFIYIFPDEDDYAEFTQFLNFGRKPNNAVASITYNTYDPGNVLKTTDVSTFSSYVLSRDNYVKSVMMKGNDQAAIPATVGKVAFSYKCK